MLLCILIYYKQSAISDNKHELIQVIVAANTKPKVKSNANHYIQHEQGKIRLTTRCRKQKSIFYLDISRDLIFIFIVKQVSNYFFSTCCHTNVFVTMGIFGIVLPSVNLLICQFWHLFHYFCHHSSTISTEYIDCCLLYSNSDTQVLKIDRSSIFALHSTHAHTFSVLMQVIARTNILRLGSGCGAVGRAVASDTRGPGFESSHRQLLLNIYLLLTVCRKDENKEKEAGNGPFKKHSRMAWMAIPGHPVYSAWIRTYKLQNTSLLP